tara:strand:+ start:180 stop:767 length:588 start_codon:yes stop_codon:yes gene_type:complete
VKTIHLFPTTVWETYLNLDLDELRREIYNFSKVTPTENLSNFGGYQGHCFGYKPLTNAIKHNVPRCDDQELGDLFISTWVNINNRGNYNSRHTHSNGINFLSGVYYVTVPKNSGNIVFFDPKSMIFSSAPDGEYYRRSTSEVCEPKENMLLLFPSWLEHEVEQNNTDEDRISISFNLIRKNHVDNYKHVYSFEKM